MEKTMIIKATALKSIAYKGVRYAEGETIDAMTRQDFKALKALGRVTECEENPRKAGKASQKTVKKAEKTQKTEQ